MKILVILAVCAGVNAAIDDRRRPDENWLSSLERIISNDELKCIPRLICERATGGQPGQLRALQVDTSSLFSLMQYLGLNTGATPMLEVGRALMTGLSNRGDSYPCYRQYPSCPRDQTRLLYYLNNHRGGFFSGFDRPYYGRADETEIRSKDSPETESRIVNQALSSNAIQSEADQPVFSRPQIYAEDTPFFFPLRKGKGIRVEDSSFYQKPLNSESSFKFPARTGKQINPDVFVIDRLPSRFSFPSREDDVFGFLSGKKQFFPST